MSTKVIEHRTYCHPEANGRKPRANESQWTLQFVLEDRSQLRIHVGREAHDAFAQFILDEAADAPSYSDGRTLDEQVSTFEQLRAAKDTIAKLEASFAARAEAEMEMVKELGDELEAANARAASAEAERDAWKLAALKTGVYRGDADVSTHELWLSEQLKAITTLIPSI